MPTQSLVPPTIAVEAGIPAEKAVSIITIIPIISRRRIIIAVAAAAAGREAEKGATIGKSKKDNSMTWRECMFGCILYECDSGQFLGVFLVMVFRKCRASLVYVSK